MHTDPATAEDRIAEIRARLDAATEGPWIHEPSEVLHGTEDVRLHYVSDQAAIADDDPPMCSFYSRADAEFVAHAREDVPFLLSELEAAQARLDKVRALHQRCDDGEQGYRPDGGYGTVAPCCETCGSYGEYTEPWPCATARVLGLGEEGDE